MENKELKKNVPAELDEKLLEGIMGGAGIPTQEPELLLAATTADPNVKPTTNSVAEELMALATKASTV